MNLKHKILKSFLFIPQIAKKVVLFIFIYIPCLLGFTFIFMILPFKIKDGEDEKPFQISIKTFFRVIAMMVGELEYADTFTEETIIINVVFFIFVVIIPIIINNLLIGLTVDNVGQLMEAEMIMGSG